MLIKCLRNKDLELSETRLTEVTGFYSSPYYINLKEWITKPETFTIRRTDGICKFHPGYQGGRSIGCRYFSKEAYAKIVRAAKKAAGVKIARKPAKKGKK